MNTTRFTINRIVSDIGESFTMSGVSRSFNARGDPTETHSSHVLSGVVQVLDGSEEEVTEGLLQKEDIMVFVDSSEPDAKYLQNDNYLTISTTTSGIFRIVNVIKNPGHYEVHAKRLTKT